MSAKKKQSCLNLFLGVQLGTYNIMSKNRTQAMNIWGVELLYSKGATDDWLYLGDC